MKICFVLKSMIHICYYLGDCGEINDCVYISGFLLIKSEHLQEYNPYENQFLHHLHYKFFSHMDIKNVTWGGGGQEGLNFGGHPNAHRRV